MLDATPHIEEHTIDLEGFPWLRDHAPIGVPVVPLADVIDRSIAAAAPLFPGLRAIGVGRVEMRGWLSLPGGERPGSRTHDGATRIFGTRGRNVRGMARRSARGAFALRSRCRCRSAFC